MNQANVSNSRQPRNIRIILARMLLVMALLEIVGATLAMWNGGSLLGAGEQRYFSDELI